MPVPLYTQTVIALVWDFDRTLIPGNMQDPIFDAYDVDASTFWAEVDGLVDYYNRQGVAIQRDIAYMVAILRARDKPPAARMLVGSAGHCDVVIPEASVSREHVWIQRQGDDYLVEEAGSTNGTFVEKTCLLPGRTHTLQPGDRLTLGNTELTFLDAEGFYVFTKRFLKIKP